MREHTVNEKVGHTSFYRSIKLERQNRLRLIVNVDVDARCAVSCHDPDLIKNSGLDFRYLRQKTFDRKYCQKL